MAWKLAIVMSNNDSDETAHAVRQQEVVAAVKIQAHARGHNWRRSLDLQREAAIRIQACVRGRLQRKGGVAGLTTNLTAKLRQLCPPAFHIPEDSLLKDARFTGHELPIEAITTGAKYCPSILMLTFKL